jgi:orotidine-5'-phosphate decarboxylase
VSFKTKIQEAAKNKGSKIVLALDFPYESPANRQKLLSKAQKILKAVHPYVCAVKINYHLVLPLGTFDGIQQLVEQIQGEGLIAIMDAKVNDIGATNQVIAEYYYAAGFDAIIANPFVGWDEGLKPLFEVSQRLNRGVILLCYMSHKGASEGYGQTIIDSETGEKTLQYVYFARKALKWSADGVVVGATYPEKIKEIKRILSQKVSIYSPGIGAQGGTAEVAVKAGADYIIVGREITKADDPAKVASQICNSVKGL